MYVHFEHTADLGLRVRAANLNDLFSEAAAALFAAIVDSLDAVQPRQAVEINIDGTDREYLLFDWLRDLLLRHHEDGMLFCQFDVNVIATGLQATARGEPIDPSRHPLSREVKAITYHELRVEPTADGWLAEVIVDI